MANTRIEIAEKNENILRFRIYPSSKVDCWLNNNYINIKYNFNIENVPESILYIPPLSQILPYLWVLNESVEVPKLDKVFYNNLDDLRYGFDRSFHAINFGSGSGVDVGELVNTDCDHDSNGVLFSGGKDSSTVFFQNDCSVIMSLRQGNYTEEEIQAQNEYISKFGDYHNVEPINIETNIQKVLKYNSINLKYGTLMGGWWGGVQFYTAFPGACAPVSYEYNLENLYIGSGSKYGIYRDAILDDFSWSGTSVSIDRGGGRKQEKLEFLSNIVRESEFDFDMRHRFDHNKDIDSNNCKQCKMTFLRMFVAGCDPCNFGFKYSGSLDETIFNIFKWFEQNSPIKKSYSEKVNNHREIVLQKGLIGDEFRNSLKSLSISGEEKQNSVSLKRKLFMEMPTPYDMKLREMYDLIN